MEFVIKELHKNEIKTALKLVWNVFLEYEAPDYSEEGIEEFYRSIRDVHYIASLSLYGAFVNERLVGVIATRNGGSHIALFFIETQYQNQGIGRKMFEFIRNKCPTNRMSVNSSPYAIDIYKAFGFRATMKEAIVNGLRFTPMELIIE